MSVQELSNRASRFQRKIIWRNVREYLAAVVVLGFFGFNLWNTDSVIMRAGAALVIAGTLYVVVQLRRRGAAKEVPADLGWRNSIEFHRQELERQRDLLRSIWRWYLLPLVPGMVVIF
ncbi:MAG: hypothetical protein GY953_09500, partial [bacterium]|nr:hypothetical protein [bacterium]